MTTAARASMKLGGGRVSPRARLVLKAAWRLLRNGARNAALDLALSEPLVHAAYYSDRQSGAIDD